MKKTFYLSVLKENYAVCRLNAFDPLPVRLLENPLSSITRTAEDLSVVCPMNFISNDFQCEEEWKCLKIHGPLDLGEVGVISSLTSVLAKAGVSVFVLSTYETDYILVKKMNIEKAAKALSDDGHEIYYD